MQAPLPIIRLELSAMKHTIAAALSERALQLDSDIKAAVEAYCTEENLSAVVRAEATRAVGGEGDA